MTGTLRGVECAGQAVAYGIKSSDTTDWLSIGLNIGLSASSNFDHVLSFPTLFFPAVVFSLPFAWQVIRKIGVVEFEKITYAIQGHGDSEVVEVDDEKSDVKSVAESDKKEVV